MKQRTRFRHLTQSDRDRIEALLQCGTRQKVIAEVLKVDKGTVSREISKRKRKNGRYDADTAQHKARVKRSLSKYQGMKVESDLGLKINIVSGLVAKRSPDEIAGRLKREGWRPVIGKDAIYHWLYSAWGQQYCPLLCSQRYRKKARKQPKTQRVMILNRVSIDERPLGASNQSRYRHWEADTAVAPKRAHNTEAVALTAERKSKLLLGTKIPSLSPKWMMGAMRSFEKQAEMKSVSADNGIENKDHEQWNIPAFFCDPHSPWQKPLIEQSIGLLRRWFFKKGTDWATVSEAELQSALTVLNGKYRKSLGYQSAREVARAHGIMKTRALIGVAFEVRI